MKVGIALLLGLFIVSFFGFIAPSYAILGDDDFGCMGETEECIGEGGCPGTRFCLRARWSRCFCDEPPDGTVTDGIYYGPGVTCTGQARPGTGNECNDDENCTLDEYCDDGYCRLMMFEHGVLCKWGTGKFCSAPTTGSIASPPDCTETMQFPQGTHTLINPCTSSAVLSKFETDDTGDVIINAEWVYSAARTCAASPNSPNKDVTPYLRRSATNFVTFTVRDICAAKPPAQTTRSGEAEFAVTNWIPNPGQICINGTIAPKCDGSVNSCGFRDCADCTELEGWHDIGDSVVTVCDQQWLIVQKTQEQVTGMCVGGPSYGSCVAVPTGETKTVLVSSQFCEFGCSGGQCNGNSRPVLSSIIALPGFAGQNATITVNATGFDPDFVYGSPTGNGPAGSDFSFTRNGVFHEPQSGDEFKELVFDVPPGEYHSAIIDLDVKVGPWAPGKENKRHNIFWFVNPGNFDMFGYVNLYGPNQNKVTIAQGIGQRHMEKPKYTRGVVLNPGTEYHFHYEYVPSQHIFSLVITEGSTEIKRVQGPPTDGHETINIVSGDTTFRMHLGFSGENPEEPATYGWKYKNLQVQFTKNNETSGPQQSVQARQRVKLACSSSPTNSSGGVFTADLCDGSFFYENPTCAFDTPWNEEGEHSIYCRIFDSEGLMSNGEASGSVFVDTTPPTTIILNPPDRSTQHQSFLINAIDNDTETGVSLCEYRTSSDGIFTRDWTERPCSGPFVVLIPEDCPTLGNDACTVELRVTNMAGNTATISRVFSTEFLFSNITSPLDNIQREDFYVFVEDRDYSGGILTNCEYSVVSVGGPTLPELEWRDRTCNSNFLVTVGPGEDCSVQGEDTCIILVRAINDNGQVSLVESRIYGIDFLTPFSTITGPTAGTWFSQDFDITISDNDPGMFGLELCERRITSKGIEIVPWSPRECNVPSTVRVGIDCIDEGGDTCSVYVRARSVSGAVGEEDNRTFGIILDPEIIKDGFISVDAVQTDIGLRFSGNTVQQFPFPPNFIACSSEASPSLCRDTFSVSGDGCGLGASCLCGNALENNCELRCNDRDVSFYLLVSGFVGAERKSFVSNIETAACPTFHIDDIISNLEFFQNLERDLSVLIMQTDFLIRNTNDTDEIAELENLILRFNEARDLVVSHIGFIEASLIDLSVRLAQQILTESDQVRAQVLIILESDNFIPTSMDFSVVVLDPYRFNTAGSVDIEVTKSGTSDVFANIGCSLTDPAGITTSHSISCFEATDTTVHIDFEADIIGSWAISCEMNRSTSSNCQNPKTVGQRYASFSVLPGADAFIEDIHPPNKAINGTNTTVNVVAYNPDIGTRYAFAQCNFIRPDNVTIVYKSECTIAQPDYYVSLPIQVFTDIVGTWTVESCSLNVSLSSGCGLSRTHNLSSLSKTSEVSIPTNMTILSLKTPPAFVNGAPASIVVETFSPTETFASALCRIVKPSTTTNAVSLCTATTIGVNNINVDFDADEIGTWNIEYCSLESATENTCLNATQEDIIAGHSFAVVPGTNLSIVEINIPNTVILNTTSGISAMVFNPTDTLLHGRLVCSLGSPTIVRSAQSGCFAILGEQSTTISASFIPDVAGSWTVDSCNLEQGASGCNGTAVVDRRENPGTFNVNEPTEPFIESVDVDDFIINASDAEVLISVRNPTSDDRFVFARCSYSSPTSETKSSVTICKGAPRNIDTFLQTSVFVDSVGVWSVSSCELFGSYVFDCSGEELVHNITGPENFEVLRGFNLSFTRFVAENVFNGTNMSLDIQVRNPSSSDRFARLICDIRNPENEIIGKTSECTRIRNGVHDVELDIFADKIGLWHVDCSLLSSLANDCTDSQLHDSAITEFNTTFPPDLEIISIEIDDEDIAIEEPVEIDVVVRNPGPRRFGIVTCDLLDPDKRTVVINASCKEFSSSATRTFDVDSILDVGGTWNLTSCSVNASDFRNCTESVLHNTTNTTLQFNVTAKRLSIQEVRPPLVELNEGDIAVIEVDVKNIDRIEHTAFVNCTVVDPRGDRIIFSSPEAAIQPQQVITFTPRRPVDITGTWNVQTCSVHRVLNSPSVIEDEQIVRENFFVSLRTECDITRPCPTGFVCQSGACVQISAPECSSDAGCPGTKDGCLCSGGRCVSCPTGFICTDHQCVQAECSIDADCESGESCLGGECVPSVEIDSGTINLLIAILIIILIPIILFVFAKKGMKI